MSTLTLADVARATGGRFDALSGPADSLGSSLVESVTIDSRTAGPGAVFAALPGEHADGHDYAADAAARGALAVLAARPVGVPAVIVDDVTTALGAMARTQLRALPEVRVVAVTGSSGKTSTKDLLAAVLEAHGPTIAPPGSYNNDLGVPLTVLRCEAGTRYLVLEMGTRGEGQIARLCAIAPPSIGVVLNVGTAHIGEFGSREAIARAKGELVEAARDVAVLNADDPLVLAMRERTGARVVTVGESPDAAVRADAVVLGSDGRARFRLCHAWEHAGVELRVVGEHQVGNALAAAAVGLECGLSLPVVAAALSGAEPRSRWRMEVAQSPGGVTVVNDAYNANPESVRAALKALAAMGRGDGQAPSRRRTWAVLGEMAELGEGARAEHDGIGRYAVRLDISRVVAVGEAAKATHAGAVLEGSWGEESVHVDDAGQALAMLRDELRPGDIVLVKGSRVAGLERLAAALLVAAGEKRETEGEGGA